MAVSLREQRNDAEVTGSRRVPVPVLNVFIACGSGDFIRLPP